MAITLPADDAVQVGDLWWFLINLPLGITLYPWQLSMNICDIIS